MWSVKKTSKSKYEFYREASLSQKLADKYSLYTILAGADKEISDKIAILTYLNDPENEKRRGGAAILYRG